MPAPKVVILDADDASRTSWVNALSALQPIAVTDPSEAARWLTVNEADLLIIDYATLVTIGIDHLTRHAQKYPAAKRVLMADFDQLTQILNNESFAPVSHVLPRAGLAENIRAAIESVLGIDAEPPEPMLTWDAATELLAWTIRTAGGVRGTLVRPLDGSPDSLEVQLVLPRNARMELFHCDLPQKWRWPVQSRAGKLFDERIATHPVVAQFRAAFSTLEVYLRPVGDDGDFIYLALLPWEKEDRVTAVLGIWTERAVAAHRPRIAALHKLATTSVIAFELPTLLDPSTKSPRTQFDEGYQWIITERYVGPDRRRADTSFLNRYIAVGKRAAPLRTRGGILEGFVDRMPRWAYAYLFVVLLLANIDTFLTFRFVRAGIVREMNPLLRPLVLHHPIAFVLVKTALASAALFFVLRLHLFAVARYLLPAALLIYATLDAYWAYLTLR